MLKVANTDLFNPLALESHNRECQNLIFPLQIKPGSQLIKDSFADFYYFTSALMG